MLNVVKTRGLEKVRGGCIRTRPRRVPLLFVTSIVRKYEAVTPVPLKRTYSFRPRLIEGVTKRTTTRSTSRKVETAFSPVVSMSESPE